MDPRVPRAASLLLSLCALAAAPSFALAQQPPASTAKTQDLASEFDALVARFEAARSAYYDEMRALYKDYDENKASEAEKAAFEKKSAELEAKDPSASYVKEFAALAERAKGTEVGAKALLQVVQNDRGEPGGPATKALSTLIAQYLQSPALKELPMILQYGGSIDRAARIDAFNKLIAGSPLDDVKAGSLFGLATLMMDSHASADDKAQARRLFADLEKRYGTLASPMEKTYSVLAQSFLFELDHLQLGMQVPDFESTDETGAKFKLSDYKGKVVVVDFWGFW
jgi:hypothetical protein